jgi:hypothetical protein
MKQFRPRAPRALPSASAGPRLAQLDHRSTERGGDWLGIAAVAAAAVIAANLRFMPMAGLAPDVVVGPGLTLHDMRGLVGADSATLDRALMDASRHVLPDVEAPDTVLGRLAQP